MRQNYSDYLQNHIGEEGSTFFRIAIATIVVGVIIGLIMILIVVNQQAKIRAIVTEHSRFQAAIINFQQKYGQLPGDSNKAISYIRTKKPLKNGNGDRFITHDNGEGIAAWVHLVESKMLILDEDLNGEMGNMAKIGVNIPSSKITGAGWHFDYARDAGGNHLGLGAERDNDLNLNPILQPAQAWDIDKRIDDGKKTTGKVHAFSVDEHNCGDESYNFSSEEPECMMTFSITAQ